MQIAYLAKNLVTPVNIENTNDCSNNSSDASNNNQMNHNLNKETQNAQISFKTILQNFPFFMVAVSLIQVSNRLSF